MQKFPRPYISIFAWWPYADDVLPENGLKTRLQTIAKFFHIDSRVYIIIPYSVNVTPSCQSTIHEVYSVKNATFIQKVSPPKSNAVYVFSHPTKHRYNLKSAPIRAIATVSQTHRYAYFVEPLTFSYLKMFCYE